MRSSSANSLNSPCALVPVPVHALPDLRPVQHVTAASPPRVRSRVRALRHLVAVVGATNRASTTATGDRHHQAADLHLATRTAATLARALGLGPPSAV